MCDLCENCKYLDTDYVWDDSEEEEVEIEKCSNGHELQCARNCEDFKEYKPKPQKETSSECDGCEYLSSCGNVIESTTKYDTSRHFIKGTGLCRKESGEVYEKKLSEIIEARKAGFPSGTGLVQIMEKAIEKFGDITYGEFVEDKIYAFME